jgi:hypothetical protein
MKKLIINIVLFVLIASSCFSQPCLPDGIEFNIQTQIDSFQINYPNCTEIEGDVFVNGNNIVNLYGLSVLNSIGGSLHIINSDELTDLIGLENLTSIGGTLDIYSNIALTSLTSLDNLNHIGEDVAIVSNPNLTTLGALNNINSLNGDLNIWNTALTNLSGLNNVTSIEGDLIIRFNATLSIISGLNNLTTIEKDFWIGSNDTLMDLGGFNSLTTIGGDFWIEYNKSLTNLADLHNVTSIGGDCKIDWNVSLTSLLGLENLTSVDGNLYILVNDVLTSLIGIENIDAASIDGLYIYYNTSLSDCEVRSICDYISNPSGEIKIHDNDKGCNNQEEVEEACLAGVTLPIANSSIKIYPNPAISEFYISNQDIRIIEITIYNQFGQAVFTNLKPDLKIDISSLNTGIYLIDLKTDKHRILKKLMIK